MIVIRNEGGVSIDLIKHTVPGFRWNIGYHTALMVSERAKVVRTQP